MPTEDQEIAGLIAELEKRRGYKINQYFQATGPYRRELYPKHLEFMRAGAVHRERLFLKANRVGGIRRRSLVSLRVTGSCLLKNAADYSPSARAAAARTCGTRKGLVR